jgi:hypothetical protein
MAAACRHPVGCSAASTFARPQQGGGVALKQRTRVWQLTRKRGERVLQVRVQG